MFLSSLATAQTKTGPVVRFLLFLFHTLLALAADWLNVFVEMILTVVVGKLFAGFNLSFSFNADLFGVGVVDWFAIGPTGVVNVPGQILPGATVDGGLAV